MNLLLIAASELEAEQVILRGRRLKHIREVHRANLGDRLRIGVIDGAMGEAELISVDADHATLKVSLNQAPPPPLPLTLLLALPRPKMLRRILQSISALGVKELILFNSYRVEKSFWQSAWLEQSRIREQLILGLEQSRDTRLPVVQLEKRFKPFVEDRLPAMTQNKRCLLAHPISSHTVPHQLDEESLLVIGPEGGFIPYEIEKLQQAGFESFHIGPRIQRVETAIPLIIGKLFDDF